ncbi:MAG: lamin tail domain-containing protein [Candidatus Liptonbacteria bacterium]|nr:lamin tail domain-containing protein [Candidatus Liptonbacteria bacterium]
MILINEWLPNPKGNDARGEWVELVNTGDAPVNLQNWQLAVNKKSVALDGVIAPHGYALLARSETKLTLGNQGGAVSLYAAGGQLADQAAFLGAASEGRSFSRFGNHFRFSEPTPGRANQLAAVLTQDTYPSSLVVRSAGSFWDIMLLALGVALALAGASLFLFKQYDQIYNLFFPRDSKTGSGLGANPLG